MFQLVSPAHTIKTVVPEGPVRYFIAAVAISPIQAKEPVCLFSASQSLLPVQIPHFHHTLLLLCSMCGRFSTINAAKHIPPATQKACIGKLPSIRVHFPKALEHQKLCEKDPSKTLIVIDVIIISTRNQQEVCSNSTLKRHPHQTYFLWHILYRQNKILRKCITHALCLIYISDKESVSLS